MRGRKWPPPEQQIGNKYGRLTVVSVSGKKPKLGYVLDCKCECGNTIQTYISRIKTGRTKSCGCFKSDMIRLTKTTHGHTAGGKDSPEFRIWCGIRQRCLNPNSFDYWRYGGAGISICDSWKDSFQSFLDYVGKRPSPKHSIDRYPNNFGNYEPGNVRWATLSQQGRNRRTNRIITIEGEARSLIEWCEKFSIRRQTVKSRLDRGWEPIKAFTITPMVINNHKKGKQLWHSKT